MNKPTSITGRDAKKGASHTQLREQSPSTLLESELAIQEPHNPAAPFPGLCPQQQQLRVKRDSWKKDVYNSTVPRIQPNQQREKGKQNKYPSAKEYQINGGAKQRNVK